MSEYMERHTVSRLIGAPPGYVGFDQGGLLTEAIAKHPHCVLLLDEIEKAHPDVFNLLLQVMDHGTLTDNNGRKADFRHVVIVMTTNAGAAEMSRASDRLLAAGQRARRHGGDAQAVRARVPQPPRRDHPVRRRSTSAPSSAWSTSCWSRSRRSSSRRAWRCTSRTPRARWIAEHGYDPKMGARPMARVIQEQIKRPLAEELLFGKLAKGGHAFVDVGADGELRIETRSTEEPALLGIAV